MKHLVLFTFALLFANSSFATQTLHCETYPKPFEVTLNLVPTADEQVDVFIQLKGTEAIYQGKIQAQVNSEQQWILGKGKIGKFESGIQGSTKRNSNGMMYLSLYSSNHNIDWGYGLHLACR